MSISDHLYNELYFRGFMYRFRMNKRIVALYYINCFYLYKLKRECSFITCEKHVCGYQTEIMDLQSTQRRCLLEEVLPTENIYNPNFGKSVLQIVESEFDNCVIGVSHIGYMSPITNIRTLCKTLIVFTW